MKSVKENTLQIKSWRVILALVVVNILIILLKHFNLNTYIIIIGFRCHISFILPFLLIFNLGFLPYIKKSFLNPEYKKILVFLVLILLPFLLVSGYLFFIHNIDLGDPDYFYEFGVSSVADYPVYLFWNFPQIAMLFLFLTALSTVSKFKFITVFFAIILLFGSEIISINHSPFPYSELGILLSCSVIFSVLINYYNNIYWFCISLFTIFWLPLLAFGTNSKSLVNLLFASQYKNWDGFFDVSKFFTPYTLIAYFAAVLIVSIIISLSMGKTENPD
jgi:hypothetical protein